MRAPIGGGGASLSPGTPVPLFRIPGHHAAPRLTGSVSRPVISGITPDKQHFLFRLGMLEGHLIVGHDLLAARQAALAS